MTKEDLEIKALKADFDEIICVAMNRYVEEKINRELKNRNITGDRVKVTFVFGFNVG